MWDVLFENAVAFSDIRKPKFSNIEGTVFKISPGPFFIPEGVLLHLKPRAAIIPLNYSKTNALTIMVCGAPPNSTLPHAISKHAVCFTFLKLKDHVVFGKIPDSGQPKYLLRSLPLFFQELI